MVEDDGAVVEDDEHLLMFGVGLCDLSGLVVNDVDDEVVAEDEED